jgi:hypothetical protein
VQACADGSLVKEGSKGIDVPFAHIQSDFFMALSSSDGFMFSMASMPQEVSLTDLFAQHCMGLVISG